MAIGLAFRVFFAALFQPDVARRLRDALENKTAVPTAAPTAGPPAEKPVVQPAKPKGRSDALTLLAALQREARLLDIVQEPLGGYSDAQIGAAARDVLRNAAAVLERFFGLRAFLQQEEGTKVEVPRGYDPQQFRLVGNVTGEPPFQGLLAHQGWVASKCELPEWNGSRESALVIAPAEVEVGGSA